MLVATRLVLVPQCYAKRWTKMSYKFIAKLILFRWSLVLHFSTITNLRLTRTNIGRSYTSYVYTDYYSYCQVISIVKRIKPVYSYITYISIKIPFQSLSYILHVNINNLPCTVSLYHHFIKYYWYSLLLKFTNNNNVFS